MEMKLTKVVNMAEREPVLPFVAQCRYTQFKQRHSSPTRVKFIVENVVAAMLRNLLGTDSVSFVADLSSTDVLMTFVDMEQVLLWLLGILCFQCVCVCTVYPKVTLCGTLRRGQCQSHAVRLLAFRLHDRPAGLPIIINNKKKAICGDAMAPKLDIAPLLNIMTVFYFDRHRAEGRLVRQYRMQFVNLVRVLLYSNNKNKKAYLYIVAKHPLRDNGVDWVPCEEAHVDRFVSTMNSKFIDVFNRTFEVWLLCRFTKRRACARSKAPETKRSCRWRSSWPRHRRRLLLCQATRTRR